jgi:malate dehydrogenase (oxaloacetate-decarboxylating)|tara:strand:+ start:2722 stop:3891 length:1170 start_codon:yes stop_codon:yes gene_type:complete
MNIFKESLRLHREKKGKISLESRVSVRNKHDLSLIYTPGVASSCSEISKDEEKVYDLTNKGNSIAIVTDGSSVMGLGNIGPKAALPVMEGKSILFKKLVDIDAIPICLNTQNSEDIIRIVKGISPSFGGVNIEDIAAPKCFEIENKLQDINIPVFHDDQHATAIVIFAALTNASKVLGKRLEDLKIIINGAGAAGIATAKLLLCYHEQEACLKNIIMCDTQGIIYKGRDKLNRYKSELSRVTNLSAKVGTLKDAIKKADVFIGLSSGGILTPKMIQSMNAKPIVFALANPIPEIMPELALKSGATIVGSGRSDYPNQINNMLAFPGIFRGALDARAKTINQKMKMDAALALSKCVKKPRIDRILPPPLKKSNAMKVANAVKRAAIKSRA